MLREGLEDMQGLIVRGYDSLNASRYILLTIGDVEKAKEYFRDLTKNYITRASKKKEPGFTNNGDPKRAVHLAFTSGGLEKLGLPEAVRNTFSRPFVEGMSYKYPSPHDAGVEIAERSTILGDTGNNDPQNWRWGNKKNPVHCALLLYAETEKDLAELVDEVYCRKETGLQEVYLAPNFEYQSDKLDREHFGFRDGISQPIINGLRKAAQTGSTDKPLNPGEFILGYINEYDHYSPSPYVPGEMPAPFLPPVPADKKEGPADTDARDLGKNGAYLVFRQMEQHVEEFWRYNYQHSKEAGVTRIEKAVRLGAKMIGRWPDGQSLVSCPAGSCREEAHPLNEFRYYYDDPDGVSCPLGAHIRRTNPRDQVHTGRNAADSLAMSSKHRMIRRGRIYGPLLDPEMNLENILSDLKDKSPASCPHAAESKEPFRGLHFLCLVSDIARQFEFVQSVWANTSTFANLRNEVDPIISPRPMEHQPDCHEFTTPQETIRKRYSKVPQFTTVVGGAYFFLPGINALNYLISDYPS